MLPFMEATLLLSWGPVAYEVDAGPQRIAVLITRAPASSLRFLAQLAERRGWLLHDLHDAAEPSLSARAVEDSLIGFSL